MSFNDTKSANSAPTETPNAPIPAPYPPITAELRDAILAAFAGFSPQASK